MKNDFNDILIEPCESSTISSRSTINARSQENNLPLITAPMDTVVSESNSNMFKKNNIEVCLPRGESSNDKDLFHSYSLSEIKDMLSKDKLKEGYKYLIDIANGHMKELEETVKDVKKKYPNIVLMAGNIANPKTYKRLSLAGADFVRVGIGNGGGCLTTENTGVGYPMASLIKECFDLAQSMDQPAKIVADGGMKTYSDIIKAIGLGADLVMVGNIFNKALESSGHNYLFKKIPVSQTIAKLLHKNGLSVYKKFRGMSTKEVQRKWGNSVLKTSEGVVRYRRVEYKLATWVENFEHYLKSAMSYQGALTLREFIGKVTFNQISQNAYKRFNK